MRRTIFLLALLATLALVAVGCNDDDGEEETASSPTLTSESTPVPNVKCPDPIDPVPEADMTKQFPQAPEMTIDTSKQYTATIKTVRGDFEMTLRPDLAPQHVNSFVFLAREGYFNGVTFHRVLPGFVAQTGDPTGSGSGGPGYSIPGEFTSEAKFARGSVGMARTSDPNSAGSQWFINYAATPSLDGQYTIFGVVSEDGMAVVDCITPRDPSTGGSLPPGDQIISIEITES
jgi:peptidylprolyl isomerase